jgi:hypothetical protein
MIDVGRKDSVKVLQLYLSPEEARDLRYKLEKLLLAPEAKKHEHVLDEKDMSREISFSLITPKKLANISGYTELEQQVLLEE